MEATHLELPYLVFPTQVGAEPRRLVMASGWSIPDYEYPYSLAPFFSRHQKQLQSIFPEGLVLVDFTETTQNIRSTDYLLFSQPRKDYITLLNELTISLEPRRAAIAFYENPVAYHYRKAGFTRTFLNHFGYVFSCLAQFCDLDRHFWIPAWNFLHDFSSGEALLRFSEHSDSKPGTFAVNPINTGIEVSRERIAIIDHFVKNLKCDVFGLSRHFEVPPCSNWKHSYVGEIPFSEWPYRFIEKVGVFTNYRFVLVIENVFADGYITEKLGEPLAALSLPIYFGPPHIERFCPNLFSDGAINGHRFANLTELTGFLRNMSEAEYHERLNVVKLHRSEYFDLTKRVAIWDFILSTFFGLKDYSHSTSINSLNSFFADFNKDHTRQIRTTRIMEHVESGIDGWIYDRDARSILFESNVMKDFD